MSHKNPPRISPALGRPEEIRIEPEPYQTALTLGAWIYCFALFVGFLICLALGLIVGGER